MTIVYPNSTAVPAKKPLVKAPPLVVKPRAAREMLSCSHTKMYQLLAAGELESFKDGRARKITVASIQRYIEKRLAA
jgi:excisionase family DNA binding protein